MSGEKSARADLKEPNELNFARFDAKLEQRIAALDAKIDRGIAELRSEMKAALAEQRADLLEWMFIFCAGTVVPLAGLIVAMVSWFRARASRLTRQPA